MGLSRFELLTPRLSSVCSNQLSYRPGILFKELTPDHSGAPVLSKLDRRAIHETLESQIDLRMSNRSWRHSRKEVIQPQVLLQLPCYDFTPITDHTFGACALAVRSATSGTAGFRGVTGGVYKARERIQRSLLICAY